MKHISVRVPTPLSERIETLASGEGIGRSELIRYALRRTVDDYRPFPALAEEETDHGND